MAWHRRSHLDLPAYVSESGDALRMVGARLGMDDRVRIHQHIAEIVGSPHPEGHLARLRVRVWLRLHGYTEADVHWWLAESPQDTYNRLRDAGLDVSDIAELQGGAPGFFDQAEAEYVKGQ